MVLPDFPIFWINDRDEEIRIVIKFLGRIPGYPLT
jgi:hypothetical protein